MRQPRPVTAAFAASSRMSGGRSSRRHSYRHQPCSASPGDRRHRFHGNLPAAQSAARHLCCRPSCRGCDGPARRAHHARRVDAHGRCRSEDRHARRDRHCLRRVADDRDEPADSVINIEGELLPARRRSRRGVSSATRSISPRGSARATWTTASGGGRITPAARTARARVPARRRADLGVYRLRRPLDGHGRRHGAGRRDQARRRRRVDALSTGVVMNIVTPRGRNEFKGSANYSFQPMDWNSDNTKGGAARSCPPRSR